METMTITSGGGSNESGAARQSYPDLSNLTVRKLPHMNLILDGVCSNCAHCGQPLTDSVSVQRGIGPTCSRRGYAEDAVEGDEIAAFICLAEFKELVAFLTEHYKPLGIRGLVNGLVRVASLNRPRGKGQEEGNAKVFAACCDAIEALGHQSMATLLRHTLVAVWIEPLEGQPGMFVVKPMKRKAPKWWWYRVREKITGAVWIKRDNCHHIRFHVAGDEKNSIPSQIVDRSGNPLSNKRALWELMIEAFEGECAEVFGKAVKIVRPRHEAKHNAQ